MSSLSEDCIKLSSHVRANGATLGDLSVRVGSKGPPFFALLFSLPFILWIAFPGLSTIFGLILMLNGIQIARKKNVWLPKALAKKKFSGERLSKFFERSGKWVKKVERVIRPRIGVLSAHPIFRTLTGICIAVSGFYLLLPLPPGTNFTPALGIALLAIGLLEDDGLFSLLGYGLFLINTFVFLILPVFGIRLLLQTM